MTVMNHHLLVGSFRKNSPKQVTTGIFVTLAISLRFCFFKSLFSSRGCVRRSLRVGVPASSIDINEAVLGSDTHTQL